MKKEYTKTELNIRFEKVLKLLKEMNADNTQVNIMDKLKLDFIYDESYFSDLKSGKRKKIPEELIKALHTHYNVNPDYLRLKSTCPFDNTDVKLENFLSFIDDWNVLIANQNEKYLHLTLDRNFYDFLIEFNRATEITDEGFSSIEQEKKALKELYSSKLSPEEFVLIPRNNLIEIVTDAVAKHKYVNEVLDLFGLSSYIDSKQPEIKSPKSKVKILEELRKNIQNNKG